jgi:D-glycero-D-manno-heptose 1,7-bisphosphate phosphatase
MYIERFIVLDRDGVINADSDDYIRSECEWVPIPGSIDAIANLTHAGYRIAIVTNQSGLSRGYYDNGSLNAMHRKLHNLVSLRGGCIEMILFCPHIPEDECLCRKPLPGLLKQLEARTGILLTGMPFIGDSLTDIQLAKQVGMEPILVKTGKGLKTLASGQEELEGVEVYNDLRSASVKFVRL